MRYVLSTVGPETPLLQSDADDVAAAAARAWRCHGRHSPAPRIDAISTSSSARAFWIDRTSVPLPLPVGLVCPHLGRLQVEQRVGLGVDAPEQVRATLGGNEVVQGSHLLGPLGLAEA